MALNGLLPGKTKQSEVNVLFYSVRLVNFFALRNVSIVESVNPSNPQNFEKQLEQQHLQIQKAQSYIQQVVSSADFYPAQGLQIFFSSFNFRNKHNQNK